MKITLMINKISIIYQKLATRNIQRQNQAKILQIFAWFCLCMLYLAQFLIYNCKFFKICMETVARGHKSKYFISYFKQII